MSKSQHVLKVQKNGVTYTCEMYTTPQEARDNLYAGKYVRFNKDGTDLYVPLTQVLNSDTESTPLLMYKKGDNTKYCIAQKSFYRANVVPVANAVITAKAYDEGGTEIDSWTTGAKWFPYGTKITASAIGNPSNIWQTPTLSIDRGSNVGDVMTVSNVEIAAAAAAGRKSYNFTVNPGANQTITLKYTEPGKNQATVSVTSARTFTVLAGTTWTASLSVATGYNIGNLNKTSGTITDGSTSITATAASIKTFTLKLNGTSGQTITLYYTQPGSSQVARTSTGYAQSWTVAYGTTWWATLSAHAGYTAGTLPVSSGTVTSSVTVYATDARVITYSAGITISFVYRDYTSGGVTISYINGSGSSVSETIQGKGSHTRSYTVKYGTSVTFKFLGHREKDSDTFDYLWGGKFYVNENGSRIAKIYTGGSYTTSAFYNSRSFACDDKA